ncbi:hypothetical protein M9H77_18829 [Catharanthus roseus]|uniref:Uncharacterized protein n=1 Tax=Catharanthus roseus TaxID=4058 RepID=A0ACC0B8J0_CATRO|nr:hypothetical protein M9H77_18829 [Catharanthus roseus]
MHRSRAPYRVWPEWYYVRHRTMRCDGTTTLWRVKEGLEIKVGLKVDLVVRWLWKLVLVRCLAGIDYEMPELIYNDLIMGSRFYPWSPTFALHVLLNSDVEVALMMHSGAVPEGHIWGQHRKSKNLEDFSAIMWIRVPSGVVIS